RNCPSGQIWRISGPVQSVPPLQAVAAATPHLAKMSAGSLPAQLTSFIGREEELQALQQLIGGSRLVTIAGPGGVGKTRMAIEVAGRQSAQFASGANFAELAPVRDPALIPEAIAIAFRAPRDPSLTLEIAVISYLQNREVLLVLDNCEHLVQPCAALVSTLLESCASLRILATSREPLGVPGEALWRLAPLAVPPGGFGSVAELNGYDAVSLLVQRASTAAPMFRLVDSNSEA